MEEHGLPRARFVVTLPSDSGHRASDKKDERHDSPGEADAVLVVDDEDGSGGRQSILSTRRLARDRDRPPRRPFIEAVDTPPTSYVLDLALPDPAASRCPMNCAPRCRRRRSWSSQCGRSAGRQSPHPRWRAPNNCWPSISQPAKLLAAITSRYSSAGPQLLRLAPTSFTYSDLQMTSHAAESRRSNDVALTPTEFRHPRLSRTTEHRLVVTGEVDPPPHIGSSMDQHARRSTCT